MEAGAMFQMIEGWMRSLLIRLWQKQLDEFAQAGAVVLGEPVAAPRLTTLVVDPLPEPQKIVGKKR
jgi:hypothetical protein